MSRRLDLAEDRAQHLGAWWEIDVLCEDADGLALDMTNGNVRFFVFGDNGLLVQGEIDDKIDWVGDAANGIARILIEPDDQSAVTKGYYRYEIWSVIATGVEDLQLYGIFQVRPTLRKSLPDKATTSLTESPDTLDATGTIS